MAARLAALALAGLLLGGARGAAAERAEVSGAVRFGALFAVHGAPAEAKAGARCGVVREHYGIQVLKRGRARKPTTCQRRTLQRVEATLLALDAINAGGALLGDEGARGLLLGAELRDSCWAPPTALRQTIELVRDAIALPPRPLAPAAACDTVRLILQNKPDFFNRVHDMHSFRF